MRSLIDIYKRTPTATRLAVAVACIISVVGIFVAVSVYRVSLNDLLTVERKNLLSVEGQATHELARIFSDSEETASVLASQESVARFLSSGFPKRDIPAILRIFTSFNVNNNYSAIYLLNKEGTALISTDPTFINQNYSFRKYYKDAIAGRAGLQMAIGITSKLPGYYFSAPVYGADKSIVGVMVMKRSPAFVEALIADYMQGKSSVKLMLTDELGVVIASNKQERIYHSMGGIRPVNTEKIINEARFPGMEITPLQYDGVQDVIESYSAPVTLDVNDTVGDGPEVHGIAKVDGFPFFFVHEIDLRDIEKVAMNEAMFLGLLTVISSLLVALMIALMVRSTFRAISKVVDSVVRISEGNFKERLGEDGSVELNALSVAFNSMVERLDGLYSSMEEKIKVATANITARAQEAEYQRQAIAETKKVVELENAKHTAILESIDNAVAVIDRESKIVFANKSAGRLFGINIDDFVGFSVYKLIKTIRTPEGVEIPKNNILGRAMRAVPALVERLSLELNNGKIISVLMIASPFSQGGEVRGFVAVLRDVAEEEKFEEIRSGFISIAAHQLRGPLTAIKWFGEMLAEGIGGKLKPKQADLALEINNAAERMSELVNTLLQTARVETGRVKVLPIFLNPVAVVKEVSKSLEFLKKQTKQKIEIVSSLPAKTALLMDRDFLMLVLQNLISNALHYSPKGSTITVTLFEHGDVVECQIKDNGIGIPRESQNEIFNKFYRARNAIRLVPEGSGIGLSLAKMLVEGWGGRIWFESEENKGAIFKFTIPKKGMEPMEGDVRLSAE